MKTALCNKDEFRRSIGAEEGSGIMEKEEKEAQVIWVDPKEEVERKRLADHVNSLDTQDLGVNMVGQTMDTMGSMNVENLTAMMNEEENQDQNKENRRSTAEFVFMSSGFSEGDSSLVDALKKLGGKLSEVEGQFDMKATHIITTKVSRSEKMLCSIASGRWVLHPNYIAASVEAGRWIEEEKFEWGNPANSFLDLKDDSTESKLAAAARRWRIEGRGCEP